MIVGQEITPAIRQTAGYLRGLGLRVTCVEFSYFQTASGERLLSADIVVGKEAGKGAGVTSKPGRRTNKKLFLEGRNAGRPHAPRTPLTCSPPTRASRDMACGVSRSARAM